MEYREMKNIGVSPSMLGFGCMRFPLKADGTIEETEAEQMIDKAIAEGVTYFDTAYPYHNGESETFVGRVLKKYPRSSFYLATKMPIWKVHSKEEAKEVLEEQMAKLQVDYVDFYLLHALNQERWKKVEETGILSLCEEWKAQGKIRYLGFSFHDEYAVFEKIVSSRKWDFCQIQYNYMDREEQAGDKGYALAEKLGIPMVVMEPVKGGLLGDLPEDLAAVLRKENPKASMASWALRWVGSHSNVKVILSGMSAYQQLLDNLETFSKFQPLSKEEEKAVEQVADGIKKRVKNGCTGCEYCMPCPFGVDIPRNFSIWNEYAMYGNKERAKQRYRMTEEKAKANQCQKCGKCETVCPQALSIRKDLEQAAKELGDLEQDE